MASFGKSKNLISDSRIYGCMLLFLLVTIFVLPSRFKMVASLAFAGILFLLVCLQRPCRIAYIKFPRALLGCLFLLITGVMTTVCFSPYAKSLMLSYVAFLLLALLIFSDRLNLPSENLRVETFFYLLVLCIVVYEVVSHVGISFPMYVSGAYDKNYLGILLFLFFAWCWSTGRKLGVLACVAAASLIGSRNYVIMLGVFLLLEFMRIRCIGPNDEQHDDAVYLRPVAVFGLFVLMFLAIAAFSFWWSNSVVGAGTTSYQVGMNDSSNAVRFNSDWYAIQHLFENPFLLLFGYDNDIISAMHIIQSSELNGTETALTGTFYNGFRIVQPHHVILNMLLKEGVLFTIGYYSVLACIFSRFFNRHNAAYWVPYLFGCMFMHSLLVSYYLVFLLVVLSRALTAESRSLSRLFATCKRSRMISAPVRLPWSMQ